LLDQVSDQALAGVEQGLDAGEDDHDREEITSVVGLHQFRSFSDIITSPENCREENLKIGDR